MSRATSRSRILAGGCLAAVSVLVASPAYAADTTSTPSATVTATASPTPSLLPSATATAVISTSLSRATSFVVAALVDGDHVVGPYGPDLSQTADVALGLAAAGDQATTLAKVVAYLDANGESFVHGDPTHGEKVGAFYAGPAGKLALVAVAAGADPTSFAGTNLIAELTASMSATGRFVDDSTFGDYSNPLGQAFAILALQRATVLGAPSAAVEALVADQCADGGFPDSFAAPTCTSSADATGLALQALVAADSGCPAARALAWLTENRAADGSFTSNGGVPTTTPVASVASTADAALGLAAARSSTTTSLAYLTSTQNGDGGLPLIPGNSPTSNLFATAQALPALARSSLLTIGPQPITAATPVCVTATSTPTSTPTSTARAAVRSPASARPTTAASSPTPRATRSTSITTTTTSATTTSASSPAAAPASRSTTTSASAPTPSTVVVSGVSIAAPAARPVVAASDLPQTGADLLTPVAVGFVLLFVGLTLLLAGGRRAGRHA